MEAATATSAATAAAEAPVVCLLEEEVGTWGEERVVMAGAGALVGHVEVARGGSMAASTGGREAKVEAVRKAAPMEVVIGDG